MRFPSLSLAAVVVAVVFLSTSDAFMMLPSSSTRSCSSFSLLSSLSKTILHSSTTTETAVAKVADADADADADDAVVTASTAAVVVAVGSDEQTDKAKKTEAAARKLLAARLQMESRASRRNSSSSSSESSSSFDLKQYIADKLPSIEQALSDSVTSDCPETEKIVDSMKYSLMAGGKRIRPVLCLAACEMFHPAADCSPAMPAAVSLEMIHTMSLIHDDLPSMDNDDLRRGKPTNHVVYGEDIAILAGDALLSQSFQHVAENTVGVDPVRVLDVVSRLGRSVGPTGLAGGQVMDLICEGLGDAVTLEDLRWIHTHKTATLLRVAVAAGAILGGASAEEVKLCEEFALKIGLAFQVADDILDCTADTAALGKTAGKDENTDKTTYPKLLGLDGSRAEAKRLVAEAKAALAPFGDRATPLLALADFIITREN